MITNKCIECQDFMEMFYKKIQSESISESIFKSRRKAETISEGKIMFYKTDFITEGKHKLSQKEK